jgi:hypothetical protein
MIDFDITLPYGSRHGDLLSGLPYFSLSLWLYSPSDLGRFFSFLIYTQSVGLLGRGISPLQGRYLHTKQHKPRMGFEPIIPLFDRVKTIHASDRMATVID